MIFSFKNLYMAYKSCLKGKVNKRSSAEFTENLESNLLAMSRALTGRAYKIGRFTCFPVTDPKLREVWAADFRDRILHHLLVSRIEPTWEKIFIHDSYACRTRKGAHRAMRKMKRILAQQAGRGSKNIFYLHVDIRGFFTSIDKNILFEILCRRNRHPDIIYLTRLIVFHDPKSDYVIKGNEMTLRDIPSHKSLFGVPEGKGLPIGNYTSQFFANVYMNELDQYAKRVLKCQNYFRYMDDVVILDPDNRRLREIANLINIFLKSRLKIELHPKKTTLQNTSKGLDFLGYVTHPEYTLSRKRVVGNIRTRLARFNRQIANIQEVRSSNSTKSGERPSFRHQKRHLSSQTKLGQTWYWSTREMTPFLHETARPEDRTKTVAIVDIIVIDVRASVIAGNPGIVVVVLLGEPPPNHCFHSKYGP